MSVARKNRRAQQRRMDLIDGITAGSGGTTIQIKVTSQFCRVSDTAHFDALRKALELARPKRAEYGLRYHCQNCGYSWTQHFQKGTKATTVACPNCECLTGKRNPW